MIEILSEGIGLVVYLLCFVLALARGFKLRTRLWVVLAFGYGCNLFAQLYWVGFMVVFGETPKYFYIADIGWAAQYLFLIMLLVECNIKRAPNPPLSAAWAPVVVSCFLCIYYIYIGNNVIACLVDNILMASIGFFAVKGLAEIKGDSRVAPNDPISNPLSENRAFAGMCLAFVVVELGLWTASCFSSTSAIAYAIFDFALFATQAGMLACAWKSEDI